MFKVVADQLKVAQGWVRCGQCGEVFDAARQQVIAEATWPDTLASVPPGLGTPGQSGRLQGMPPEQPLTGFSDNVTPGAVGTASADPPVGMAPEPRDLELDEVGAEALESTPSGAGSPLDVSLVTGKAPVNPLPAQPESQEPLFPLEGEAATDISFVRDADSGAFWASSPVRAVLGAVCIMLLVALALQWVLRQKDILAAQEPRLAPVLQALCRPLGCVVGPLRRIESLLIESANFTKTGPNAYRLAFVLKNVDAVALEIPALEVTLTDSRDEALVRRVVMPAQFGAAAATLAAYSELTGTLMLKISSDPGQGTASRQPAELLPVASYRIVAFYP
ncbi:MAG: family finger-like protein [Polaromonas sp.]|nr:family finger-like protein [Polaromonas sp.]